MKKWKNEKMKNYEEMKIFLTFVCNNSVARK